MAQKDDGPRELQRGLPPEALDWCLAGAYATTGDLAEDYVHEHGDYLVNLETARLISPCLPFVLGAEAECFPDPYSDVELLDLMSERTVNGIIVRDADSWVMHGYMIYALRRRCYEILRIGVVKDARGIGAGRMLVDQLKEINIHRNMIVTKIPDWNIEAMSFFSHHGFANMQNLPGAYLFRYFKNPAENQNN